MTQGRSVLLTADAHLDEIVATIAVHPREISDALAELLAGISEG